MAYLNLLLNNIMNTFLSNYPKQFRICPPHMCMYIQLYCVCVCTHNYIVYTYIFWGLRQCLNYVVLAGKEICLSLPSEC